MSETSYFSTLTNGIFKHNTPNYQEYYDFKADFIVDLISNPSPSESLTFGPIKLIADVTNSNLDSYDSCFDRIVQYSSDSSTGLQSLFPQTNYSSVEYNPTRVHFSRKGREFHINEMRNIKSLEGPVFSSAWEDILTEFPIDRVPVSFSYATNLFQISRITDEFLGTRLYFNPGDTLRITLDQVHTTFKPFTR